MSCRTTESIADGEPQARGVVFTGMEWYAERGDDPSGVHAGWIQTVQAGEAMQAAGVPGEAVQWLYEGGQGVCSEPLLRPGHCRGLTVQAATAENLRESLRRVARQADDDDQLLVHLSAHGEASGVLRLDNGERIGPSRLSAWLQSIPGSKLVVLDACYGERFLCQLDVPGATLVATAREDELGWVDRYGSFGPRFLCQLRGLNGLPDLTAARIQSAFFAASQQYQHHGRRLWQYIATQFDGSGLPEDQLALLTFEPVLQLP